MSAVAAPDATEVMTYREALRLALREELARDERVFVMGEEVGLFDGSYKVTAGLMDEFGPDRIRDTPISEEGFVGAGRGRRDARRAAGRRDHDDQLPARSRWTRSINHAAKVGAMFGGEVRCPLVIRTPNGARQPAHRAALAVVRRLVRRHARPQGRGARLAGRRQGPAQGRHPRRRPGARDREPADLQAEGRGAARPRLRHADRARADRAPGHRPDDRGALVSRSCARWRWPSGSPTRTACRSRSSTCARCARSTWRPSRSRWPARAARSAWRRAGRATASPPSWRRGSRRPASTSSTRRSSGSAWPRCRCPTPRASSTRRCRTRTASRAAVARPRWAYSGARPIFSGGPGARAPGCHRIRCMPLGARAHVAGPAHGRAGLGPARWRKRMVAKDVGAVLVTEDEAAGRHPHRAGRAARRRAGHRRQTRSWPTG